MMNAPQSRLPQPAIPLAHPATPLRLERVFQLSPIARVLFPDDVERQAHAILTVLTHTVEQPDQLQAHWPAIRMLAQRYNYYGVKPCHYLALGDALLEAVETASGSCWSEATRQQWRDVYDTLADLMMEVQFGGYF